MISYGGARILFANSTRANDRKPLRRSSGCPIATRCHIFPKDGHRLCQSLRLKRQQILLNRFGGILQALPMTPRGLEHDAGRQIQKMQR